MVSKGSTIKDDAITHVKQKFLPPHALAWSNLAARDEVRATLRAKLGAPVTTKAPRRLERAIRGRIMIMVDESWLWGGGREEREGSYTASFQPTPRSAISGR